MASIQKICVYCGSGSGTNPKYLEAATTLGADMARQGIGLVYGGGAVGLMGAVAGAVRENGGDVTGIIPEFLIARERQGKVDGDLIVVPDMHERKRRMFDLADAFVALPGGVGTLEELVEQMTWAQLGRHKKPILLANIGGFWNPLCALLDHMRATEFIRYGLRVETLVADHAQDIIPKLRAAAAAVSEDAKELTPTAAATL